MNSPEVAAFFFSLGVLLLVARLLGELAERFNQPAVLGELVAGILLGPTVLGTVSPEIYQWLFPPSGARAVALEGFRSIAIVLFLLVSGMEVDLSSIWRQGRVSLTVSFCGIIVPFTLGLAVAYLAPGLFRHVPEGHRNVHAFFFATALSISALPVIAKTLMDLNLFRTDLGMTVIAAAIFNDLAGWIIFALILGVIGVEGENRFGIGMTITLTLLYTGGMLTAGRWLVNRVLPFIQAHTRWPGGVLGFALTLAMFGAAFTEWIGIHALFGSFLIGVVIGDSRHLREHTRSVIGQFVSFIFAPIFFGSIGLKVNFISNFNPVLISVVLVIACLGKIVGCGLGAQFAGMNRREAWAVGFAMNARGVMEIILGLLALQYGIIGERMFVALVVMALVTSLMGGPAIQRLLRRKKPRRFTNFMKPRAFLPSLAASGRREAIKELSQALCAAAGLDPLATEAAVAAREEIIPTGIGEGVAIPHARIDRITAPVVGLGLSNNGIDFDAPDGKPAKIIFMIIAPQDDDGAQIEILADIARTFKDPGLREKALAVRSYTELLALLKAETPAG